MAAAGAQAVGLNGAAGPQLYSLWLQAPRGAKVHEPDSGFVRATEAWQQING